jgi:autotransporter-associated beta strand protein
VNRLISQWNCRLSGPGFSGKIFGVFVFIAFFVPGVFAQSGYWINNSGGSWVNAGNWDPADGIAGGVDNTAYFGFGPEGSISPNSSFTVDGSQTIGNLFFTSQGNPGNWTFNSGSGGSITLDNNFGASEITVASAGLQVNLDTALGGDGDVQKDGAGTLVMGGVNTYSGQTLVSGGSLDVNGSLASGGVTVTNAALGGTGTINGAVVVDSGGTLNLDNSSGPLSINNSLVLKSGSKTIATIADSGRPLAQGLTSVTYGGTLIVNGLAGGVSLGQNFSIFGSAAASGNFSSIQPPPGPWLRWEFNPSTGQMTVVSSASQPHFATANLSAGKLAYQLSGGPPGSPCYILLSTNLILPMSAWTRVATNSFDMGGNCAPPNALDLKGAGQVYVTAFIIPTP